MRYIIKRRLLIRAKARWVKCLLQRRGLGSIALPMRLNRAPYGSMCDRAVWICPLFTVFLWQAERLKEWQSEVQAKNKVRPYLQLRNRTDTSWGSALCSSITSCAKEPVASKSYRPFSCLLPAFDLFRPTRASACGTAQRQLVCDQDRTENWGIDRVPVTVKFKVTASWSLLTLEVNGLPGGLENPTSHSGTDFMQMCVHSRKDRVHVKGEFDNLSHFITDEFSVYYPQTIQNSM